MELTDMLIAFLISTIYILVVTVQYGLVAEKRWLSVPLEIPIATFAVLNVLNIVRSFGGQMGYVLGSTLGCYLAIVFLRRRSG